MDANVSDPLVVLPPEHGTLVPVATGPVADFEPAPDRLAWLWQHFCKLAVLLFLLLAICRRLRRELIELRQQANYWKAQHQRAIQREADLAAQVDLLQGEIREWKRRFFGRKSETVLVQPEMENCQV